MTALVMELVALSPDGRQLVFVATGDKGSQIWLRPLDQTIAQPLAGTEGASYPIWSQDGSRVAFCSTRSGPTICMRSRRAAPAPNGWFSRPIKNKVPLDWSPDGHFVLYETFPKTGPDLWALPMTGDRAPFPVVQTSFAERNGQFSPDGRWVAYDSNESGLFEVFVQPFPGPGGKWQVSSSGGVTPRWQRDGRELLYVAPDGALIGGAGTIRPRMARRWNQAYRRASLARRLSVADRRLTAQRRSTAFRLMANGSSSTSRSTRPARFRLRLFKTGQAAFERDVPAPG